mgnify:CR=1 FL=1
MSSTQYEIAVSPQGFASIRQCSSGEVMHPCGDPYQEAMSLYVEQSRLAELLADEGFPLVVWDVGLGAACNAMAALRCAEGLGNRARDFELVSFETNLEPLTLARSRLDLFPHVDHPAAAALLADGSWEGAAGLRWSLLKGDFLERMFEAPLPDVIFYDPFSYKTEDAPLWTADAFAELAQRLQRAPKPVCIYTYTRATRVRAQLLQAGFYVGHGVGTGAKSETTVAVVFGRRGAAWSAAEKAAFCAGRGVQLLGAQWLERWQRSQLRSVDLDAAVRASAQFAGGP